MRLSGVSFQMPTVNRRQAPASNQFKAPVSRPVVARPSRLPDPRFGMLVLSRHRDESIVIGDDIIITVVDIRGDKVRLGIEAPQEVSVHRQEVYNAIQRENRQGRGGDRLDLPAKQRIAPRRPSGQPPQGGPGRPPLGGGLGPKSGQ